MYELLGICLALTALLAINASASAFAEVAWRVASPHTSHWRAAARARLLFALRVLPSAFAAAFVFVLVVPAYLLNEPLHSGETVGVKMLALAAVSAAGVLAAVWRIAGTWRATRRLARGWMLEAESVAVEGMSLPAYRIHHRFPVIAVVGVFRPRLFIASQIFDSLTGEELAAALAHERGHVEARDNLKRALLRAGQDALLFAPLGRSLSIAWARASELAADEFAASEDPSAALELASAIVKISRLIPAGVRPTLPAGAHLLGECEDSDGLSRRVTNLLRFAGLREDRPKLSRAHAGTVFTCAFWLGLSAACLFVATHPSVLKLTHAAIERVVGSLG